MSETDGGSWTIVHPQELLATFLLPLPSPVALADGVTVPTYQHLSPAAVDMIEPWLDELWLQNLAGTCVVPGSSITPGPGDTASIANWSNKYALLTSIQFHQTFSDAPFRLGLDQAMTLANVVSRSELTIKEKAQALDQASRDAALDPSRLREMGMGVVTVAECAVGLRLIGDLPSLSEPLTLAMAGDSPFGPIESDRAYPEDPSLWRWRCFESGSAIELGLLVRRLVGALNLSLGQLRSIERGVYSMNRLPIEMPTIERLPIVVPVVLRRSADVGVEGASRIALLGTGSYAEHLHLADPLTDDRMVALDEARLRAEGGPFSAHLDLFREAQLALEELGNYRLATLLFGIAAESLFDELILHLMWEEGSTPEIAAETWTDGLTTRVRKELPPRIGGPWDMTARNPIAMWAQHVASVRHRVAHAAYAASEGEARRSMSSVTGLVSHLCSRLATPEALRRYPRTALVLVGEDGLRRRGAYTKRLQRLQNDPSEPPWAETFSRWREAWRRVRQDLTAQPREPDEEGSSLLAVCHPDGAIRWIRHDREQHLAIEVEMDRGNEDSWFAERLRTIRDGHRESGNELPISVGYLAAAETTPRQGSQWVEEYHAVPMAQVMVDRSDFRRPVTFGISPSID